MINNLSNVNIQTMTIRNFDYGIFTNGNTPQRSASLEP